MTGEHNLSSLIWGFADLLYNNIEASNYHKVILPLTLLRRFDCVLKTPMSSGLTPQDAVAALPAQFLRLRSGSEADRTQFDQIVFHATRLRFYNVSGLDFDSLAASNPSQVLANFRTYIDGFSENVKDVLANFSFTGNTPYLEMLHKKNILVGITQKFAGLDLSPNALPNEDMGELYEALVRKWADSIKADAGEFFTPRDIVHLLADLVFAPDAKRLKGEGVIKTAYDPTIGTGGLVTVMESYARSQNPKLRLNLYGQELKDLSYAVCAADLLIKHASADANAQFEVRHGNTLTNDLFPGRTFDYVAANPPYGAPWGGKDRKHDEDAIRAQTERFAGGFPQTGDSALLFVQHIVNKMKPTAEGGARAGIVLAGSPLFNGDAGSGESEIRRWLIEQDLIEAIVALPTELFFDTGIGTFIWILSNRKSAERKGKIQLIDARDLAAKVRKPTGMKRYEITEELKAQIHAIYESFETDGKHSKVFDSSFFGYRKIAVEQPLIQCYKTGAARLSNVLASKPFKMFLKKLKADEHASQRQAFLTELLLKCTDEAEWGTESECLAHLALASERAHNPLVPTGFLQMLAQALATRSETGRGFVAVSADGSWIADPARKEYERLALHEDVEAYLDREVRPFVEDGLAQVDCSYLDSKTGEVGRIGYEINFNRYFYVAKNVEPSADILKRIQGLEAEFVQLMKGVG